MNKYEITVLINEEYKTIIPVEANSKHEAITQARLQAKEENKSDDIWFVDMKEIK